MTDPRQALTKFALITLTINDLLGDTALATTALNRLKVAFSEFASNKQQHPLAYESEFLI